MPGKEMMGRQPTSKQTNNKGEGRQKAKKGYTSRGVTAYPSSCSGQQRTNMYAPTDNLACPSPVFPPATQSVHRQARTHDARTHTQTHHLTPATNGQ